MNYKFNIKPEDCNYIINKDKRKIVCIIEKTRNMFVNFAERNFVLSPTCVDDPWGIIPHRELGSQLLMPNRFWGIATCSEDDEWDEETGKLIAYSRAKDKLNKSFFKRADLYVKTLDRYVNDSIDVLNRLGEKLEISTERRYKKISNALGEQEVED